MQFNKYTRTDTDTDAHTDGIENEIGEAEGEAKKRKKKRKNCRRDQALLFRTRHHLGRKRVTLAGTRQLRSQGLVHVHVHRIEGVTASRDGNDQTESGAGSESGAGT